MSKGSVCIVSTYILLVVFSPTLCCMRQQAQQAPDKIRPVIFVHGILPKADEYEFPQSYITKVNVVIKCFTYFVCCVWSHHHWFDFGYLRQLVLATKGIHYKVNYDCQYFETNPGDISIKNQPKLQSDRLLIAYSVCGWNLLGSHSQISHLLMKSIYILSVEFRNKIA